MRLDEKTKEEMQRSKKNGRQDGEEKRKGEMM